jgi:hypothetical protein
VTYKVVVSAEVNSQILSASAFYEGIKEGLGEAFEREIERVLDLIGRSPNMYPKEFADVRKAYLARFKQIIYYVVRGDSVGVLELRDARREPPDWRARGFTAD